MFADISGSTQAISALDPEIAMGVLDPIVKVMTRSVVRFGGMVSRIEGDGIMALFGAPVAREDHAVHACLAAQAILAEVAELQTELGVRVGLDSGEVVIRAAANDPRGCDAVGITVHRAHRMEQQASAGAIFLSASTAEMARRAVDLEALGHRSVPGLAEPLQLYRLIQAYERPAWEQRAAHGCKTVFAGRRREFRWLQLLLGRAGEGRGQVVTITANAGLGKSRLVHEFLQWLPGDAWTVLSVAALSHAQGTPYRLAVDILRSVLGITAAAGKADITDRLASFIRTGESRLDVAPLQALLDLHVDDRGWLFQSAAARRDRTRAALCDVVLQQSRQRKLLLVLEDLQWCDPQSRACLVELQAVIPAAAIMLLATTRPLIDGAGGSANWWGSGHRRHWRHLSLRPLDRCSSEMMLAQLLGSGDALADMRARIIAQSDGTPLFIEELSYALIERGLVVSDPPDMCMSRRVTDVEIPPNVRAVLAARIDQLLPEHRRLLQVAAVIGMNMPSDVLAAVADLPEPTLESRLASLQASEFLRVVTSASGVGYAFRHELAHAVSYRGLLRGDRFGLQAKMQAVLARRAAALGLEDAAFAPDQAWRDGGWPRLAMLASGQEERVPEGCAVGEAGLFCDPLSDCAPPPALVD